MVDGDWFERTIRPVLSLHCNECHGESGTPGGGLRLDTLQHAKQGGISGPAWSLETPESSRILAALTSPHPASGGKPLAGLPSNAAEAFRVWIAAGTPWPATPAGSGAGKAVAEFPLAERKAKLPWIWERPTAARPPSPDQAFGASRPVDQFVFSRLKAAGLKPAPPVAPTLWLRRVYFALTGLPPGVAEVLAFEQDHSPQARERVVDQLLASPRFGERWARHWMDLVRYAESRGHEGDYVIPGAFEYRDYLIRALNADVPYDQLVREHLAGDLLASPRRNPVAGFNESVIGTGWAFLGEEIHAPVDTRQDECDRTDNRIDVLSKTFLGLTVSCARCHDHKFDAISQKDYYAMAGFFISSGYRQARFETDARDAEAARRLHRLHAEFDGRIRSALAASQAPVTEHFVPLIQAAASVLQRAGAVDAAGHVLHSPTNGVPEGWRQLSASEATATSLSPRTVEAWSLALLRALEGKDPLLAPVALAALGNGPAGPVESSEEPLARLPTGARLVANYGRTQSARWVTDGLAFGSAPTAGGTWLVAERGDRADLRIATRTAAVVDPVWARVHPLPGTDAEPTIYGGWNRAGRVLRAPKYMLGSGRIHYLARGGGRVLASVDSQVLVTGPLHTVLAKEWSSSREWRWISHDLSDYAGHRVSLEFTPGPDADLELAAIVESDTAPATPHDLLAAGVGGLPAVTTDRGPGLLREWGNRLRSAAEAYAANDTSARALAFVDWQMSHPELFTAPDGTPAPWIETVNGYLAARKGIEATIQWESRTAPALVDGNGVDEFLLKRGSPGRAEGEVPRRFLEAVSGTHPLAGAAASGRLELANVLATPANPLVARVFVNRVWHHLFGRGIVPTVDNFGVLGERPSHPELLDYLAVRFVERDQWSLKRLVRDLILTDTFAMDSALAEARTEEQDPDNRLLHRSNLRRLEGESIRDAILTVSGRLTDHMYGPGVPLHPSQFIEARGLRAERGPLDGDGRRTIYVAARRNFLPMMMLAFDTPIPFTTNGRRNVSNVPAQMLFLMNDPFVHQQAKVCADRWRRTQAASKTGTDELIETLFLAYFSRRPTGAEIQRCRTALAMPMDGAEPLTELCHALFGVKEFVYLR